MNCVNTFDTFIYILALSCVTLYYPVISKSAAQNDLEQNKTIEQTLKLLEEGNTRIRLSTHEDIVLVVGNTGAGKTTVTHFIAGDDSKLHAYEVDEATILIRDLHSKISTSTIVSKTIFPELLIDNETNTAFYDCPGFSDTRNTTIEIVNSYFVKKVAESARRVKILLIVNYNSVRQGGDRGDFILLLKHTSNLLRNTEKFRESIAMVATKVESGKKDFKIISGIASFLNATKRELRTILSNDEVPKAQHIIDALLTKNEEENEGKKGKNSSQSPYTRITYFKQPNVEGPLNMIKPVQVRKGHMRNVIWNNIQFVSTSPADFGYTISDKARNDIQKLISVLSDQIYDYFNQLSLEIKNYFKTKMNNLAPSELAELVKDLLLMKNTSLFLQQFEVNANQQNQSGSLNFTHFLNTTINHLKIKSLSSSPWQYILKALLANGEYLDFFHSVTVVPRLVDIAAKYRWLEPLRNVLLILESQMESLYLRLNSEILRSMNTIGREVENFFINSFQDLNRHGNFTEHVRHLLNSLKKMRDLEFSLNSGLEPEDAAMKPSNTIELILGAVEYLNPNIVEEELEIKLKMIGNFLDSCKGNEDPTASLTSPLFVNPSRWLQVFRTSVLAIRAKLGLVEVAMLMQTRNEFIGMTEKLELHYGSILVLEEPSNHRELETAVRDFIDLRDDIRNFSHSSFTNQSHMNINRRGDIEFLNKSSFKISTILQIDFTRTINELNENMEFLHLNFPTDVENKNSSSSNRIWLAPLNRMAISVESKFNNYFQDQGKHMQYLLVQASSQLQQFYLDKINELAVPSTTSDTREFKNQIVSILNKLKDTEYMDEERLLSFSPSQILNQLIEPCLQMSPMLPIFTRNLVDNLKETSKCLDLIERFNFNKIQITTLQDDKEIWLSSFRTFLPRAKSKFRLVWNATESMIGDSIQNLTDSLASFYASKFLTHSSTELERKYTIINLKESLQQDLSIFKNILENLDRHYRLYKTAANTRKFLKSTVEKIVEILKDYRGDIQTTLVNLELLGECLDFMQSYLSLHAEPSTWFNSLRTFAHSFNETINAGPKCKRKADETLVVEGTFISIKEFVQNSTCLSQTTENLIILASHTVLIDADIIGKDIQRDEEKPQLNLAIIAPHWIINGERVVDINGAPGKDHHISTALNKRNGDGLSGLPGLPGGNAGNFFGVGSTLNYKINNTSDRLNILASGGVGGEGQAGGNGLEGANGENVTLDKIGFAVEDNVFSFRIHITKHHPFKLKKVGSSCGVVGMHQCAEYWFNGTRGKDGRRGGNGGVGGLGGKAGLVSLFGSSNFTQELNFSIIHRNQDGSIAPGGQGGSGGKGGIHGFNAKVQIFPGKHGDGYENQKKILEVVAQGEAHDGKEGKNNSYAHGREKSLNSTVSLRTQSSVLNIFRNYARSIFGNILIQKSLDQFLKELDEHELVLLQNDQIPIGNFLQEFLALQSTSRFQSFHINSNHVTRHDKQDLLFIERFSEKINQLLNSEFGTKSSEARKVLSYLYTASLSTLNTYDNKYDSTLITNMNMYLEVVQTNLMTFKQQSSNFNSLSVIKKVSQDYSADIHKEIQTARDFIMKDIIPEISSLQNELDSSLEKLLGEILELKIKIEEDKANFTQLVATLEDEISQEALDYAREIVVRNETLKRDIALLEEKRKTLGSKVLVHQILKVLNAGSGGMRAKGGKGMFAQMVVKAGVFIAEKIVGMSIQTEVNAVDELNQITIDEYFHQNLNQLSGFKMMIQDIKTKLMRYPTVFAPSLQVVNIIYSEFRGEDVKWKAHHQAVDRTRQMPKQTMDVRIFINNSTERLRTALRSNQQLVKSEENTTMNSQSQQQQLLIIDRIIEDLRLTPAFYSKIRDDQSKIDEVKQALKATGEKIQELETFGNKIENDMTTVVEEFRGQVINPVLDGQIESPFTSLKTTTNLWNLSKKIRDMKILVRQEFTGNASWQVDAEVSLIFDKFDQCFTMLSSMYEKIANFHKESRLGNFITKINSASLETIPLEDSVLADKVQRVELVILSNVIIAQYNMIMNSLTMATFPLAEIYMKLLQMPKKLRKIQLENSKQAEDSDYNGDPVTQVQQLAEAASNDIESLRDKILTTQSTHNVPNEYIRKTSYFESKSASPFYVWEYDKYQYSIRRLLSGQSVLLKADVVKSPARYDAVKLSRVDVNFKAVFKNGNLSLEDKREATERMNARLKSELDHYKITMTHMGNSAYRYDGKYYSFRSQPVSFSFSFEKDSNSLPVDRNSGVDNWGAGDILLSPYALWKFHLTTYDGKMNFSALEQFSDSQEFQVDLELIGSGTYVEKGWSREHNMNDYYKVDESI